MEFANEADERDKEAEVCVLDIEDELKNALEELEEYKKKSREAHVGFLWWQVSETQLIEELHLMREKITMLEQSRLQECSDNPIHYSKCSLLKADDQIPRPHVLAAMPHNHAWHVGAEYDIMTIERHEKKKTWMRDEFWDTAPHYGGRKGTSLAMQVIHSL
ncbi:hypothetical protein IFM89_011745 [Coptis chinensis]|uniref:Uncharacterized protein n=1 Tax=Coptis chinensis TaxID=261450 RepID=A0A835IUX7_9MAGN|nr:hypothetical protein IFM89_011745 [Coptis chinensis]